jgi:hypothetical protein
MRAALTLLVLLATTAFATSTQDQIMALLQTGTKASDAIDAVFDLLNDLKQENIDAQYAADLKNDTDEFIGQETISKFTEIMNLNRKLFNNAIENRERFEHELQETKNYLAWNEARVDEIHRKMETLMDNQCYSNQLFVRSIKMNIEALEVVRTLKQDVAGYVIAGDSFEFNQMPQSEVRNIGEKLSRYSHLFSQMEVKSFLELANEEDEHHDEEHHDDEHSEEEGEEGDHSGRKGTLAERVLGVLEDLETNLHDSLDNLEKNEIAAAWELAGWVASSQAELDFLATEHEKKTVYADRCATQIQAALAQQAKSAQILKESQNALD